MKRVDIKCLCCGPRAFPHPASVVHPSSTGGLAKASVKKSSVDRIID